MISTAYAAADAGAHDVPLYGHAEFWVAVAFFIVVGFAWKPVSRAIVAGLDMRRDKIKARLDDANKLREDAEAMLIAYQRKQAEAMKEAEEIIAHARAEAARMAEQAAKDLEEALQRRERMAMDRIAQAETEAVREVRNLAVDVAMVAARQVIADGMTAKQANTLIDESIKGLAGKLH